MRILFITNLYPPHDVGGYEQMCQETADHLRERGHEVLVLTSRYGVGSRERPPEPGVIRRLHLQTDLNHYEPIRFLCRRPFEERFNVRQLRRVIDRYQPDAAVIWGMWNLSHRVAYWAEKWLPGRTVYYVSSYWPADPDPDVTYWRLPANHASREVVKAAVRKWLESRPASPSLHFEHTLCVSRHVRDALLRAGKVTESAQVAYLGIDPRPFQRAEPESSSGDDRPLRLLYFGRLIPDKGVHTAIEALNLLKRRGLADQMELTILGSGHPDYEAQLHEMVRAMDLGRSVHFVKKVPREHVPDILRKFDVFLFTSVWPEPFARTVLEALAAGMVVIAANVGGTPELFEHGYDASLLFPAEDAESLAERIARVSASRDLRDRLAVLGRQLVSEQFTSSHLVDAIETKLTDIISRSRAAEGMQGRPAVATT